MKQLLGILEDDVPNVPLYITTNYFIKQPYVKGWDNMGDPHGSFGVQGLPYAWIDKK